MSITISSGCTDCGWSSNPQPYTEGDGIPLAVDHDCPAEVSE